MAINPPPQAGGHKLVFLHLPKTGGTTLHHHFSAHFAPEEICPEQFSNLHAWPHEQLDRYRYFSGHFNFDQIRLIPGPLFLVTVLRDPVEQLMSSYLFWKRHTAGAAARPGMEGPALARASTLAAFLRIPHQQVQDSVSPFWRRASPENGGPAPATCGAAVAPDLSPLLRFTERRKQDRKRSPNEIKNPAPTLIE